MLRSAMIVLNFAHPLTGEHLRQLEVLTGRRPERVVDVSSHIDPDEPLAPQVVRLVDSCHLSCEEWQTLAIVVNPPSLNFSAVTLVAELHGRMGYFPTVLRMRPVADAIPPRFEIAEIIDLQNVRDQARRRR